MDKQQIIEKLICDMQLPGLSTGTIKAYCQSINQFQEYFKKPATELWESEIRTYLHYLKPS